MRPFKAISLPKTPSLEELELSDIGEEASFQDWRGAREKWTKMLTKLCPFMTNLDHFSGPDWIFKLLIYK